MISKRNRPLYLLVFLLILVGFAMLEGRLLVLSIPILSYLLSGYLAAPEKLDLQVSRHVSIERIEEGRSIDIELQIHNQGSSIEQLRIEEHVPEGLTRLTGETSILTGLAGGERLTLNYRVEGRRGVYPFQGVSLSGGDFLGAVQHESQQANDRQLNIFPSAPRLRPPIIRPLQTRVYAGLNPARLGGPGVAFYGLRRYQPGDPIKRINWRASARQPDTLHINQFVQERVADVGMILDARNRSHELSSNLSLFEYSVQATASLADAFLAAGNRVGLLVYGSHLDWTFPGYGKIQREKILRALTAAQIGNSQIFESLHHLPTRLFIPQSQLVLVSPLRLDDLKTLIRLRALKFELIVVSPDPISFEAGLFDTSPNLPLAIRLARLERTLLIRKLYQAGIMLIQWNLEDPLEHVLDTKLKRPLSWIQTSGASF